MKWLMCVIKQKRDFINYSQITNVVIPAKAGIQFEFNRFLKWIPAFAGMTTLVIWE